MSTPPDPAALHLEDLSYPLAPAALAELTQLLRTEWTAADYDPLDAMSGDAGEHLVIISILARRHGIPVATATIHFARKRPEVGVIGSVLTHRDYRGQGLAGSVVERAVTLAKSAGCAVCLLGTAMKPRNVYHQHGFDWFNGSAMRRNLGPDGFDARYFAPGQPTEIRPATWGDLGGVSLLFAQPLAMVGLDFPRGLFSGRYIPVGRCLSNLPAIWNETVLHGGAVTMLAEPASGRIFGLGSLTVAPGSARKHTAQIDLCAHDHYLAQLPELLADLLKAARARDIKDVHIQVAAGDEAKLACLRSAGFQELARLRGALRLASETRDVLLLGLTL